MKRKGTSRHVLLLLTKNSVEREDEDHEEAEEEDEREKEELTGEEAERSETETVHPERRGTCRLCGREEQKEGQAVAHPSRAAPSVISSCRDYPAVQSHLRTFPTTLMRDRRRSFQPSCPPNISGCVSARHKHGGTTRGPRELPQHRQISLTRSTVDIAQGRPR
ncbi:hypothetical protein CHARACLAT_030281 [Characodon lateralis]|uniref:Uncharacterized protein n=1 Tax=Characodon lateralis TaxID=208331 RepID=A0ABU7D559_9TELE|nr:hypothetical protein [Characodon lateralis]